MLVKLREQHVVVARLANDLETLLAEHATGDAAAVRVEIERIATELEAHFEYEEAQIVPALNALTGPVPWAESGGDEESE